MEAETGAATVSSAVLESVVGRNNMRIPDFFDKAWQQTPILFQSGKMANMAALPPPPSSGGYGKWREGPMDSGDLWNEMVHQGWSILSNLLERSEARLRAVHQQDPIPIDGGGSSDDSDAELPILFRNQQPIPPEEVGHSLFAAYLDGCSVVVNHADLQNPHIAALCLDLQRSFPHAYANVYCTPPGSQAVPAHADDRDVLVFQLVGRKIWTVYQNVPIPFPYPHEQVGKDGLVVPRAVLEGPTVKFPEDGCLYPGDVLYLPRGMVHRARAQPDALSMHITVALATHDWTLAENLGRAVQRRLQRVVEHRTSLLPLPSSYMSSTLPSPTTKVREEEVNRIQTMIDQIVDNVRREVTARAMLEEMTTRIENHNRRAYPLRMKLIHRARVATLEAATTTTINQKGVYMDPSVAKTVTFTSLIRAATPVERQKVINHSDGSTPIPTSNAPVGRGLQVREDVADGIMEIIAHVKAHPTHSYCVADLLHLMAQPNPMICDLTLLSMVKRAVELGAFVVVSPPTC